MHTKEHQQIEIQAVLGGNKLILRRTGDDDVIGVRVSTPDYNATAIVNLPDFLAAARVLCEGPEGRGESPVALTPPSSPPSTPTTRILALIAQERARQNTLVDAGKIPWNCASPMVLLSEKNMVWSEEVLEAQREFCAFSSSGLAVERHEAKHRLHQELIQVAAVTVAILESLEGQP